MNSSRNYEKFFKFFYKQFNIDKLNLVCISAKSPCDLRDLHQPRCNIHINLKSTPRRPRLSHAWPCQHILSVNSEACPKFFGLFHFGLFWINAANDENWHWTFRFCPIIGSRLSAKAFRSHSKKSQSCWIIHERSVANWISSSSFGRFAQFWKRGQLVFWIQLVSVSHQSYLGKWQKIKWSFFVVVTKWDKRRRSFEILSLAMNKGKSTVL